MSQEKTEQQDAPETVRAAFDIVIESVKCRGRERERARARSNVKSMNHSTWKADIHAGRMEIIPGVNLPG